MPDPLKTLDDAARSEPPLSISRNQVPIAGIMTTIFGLDEVPAHTSDVACLWLLHPRLATQERMAGIAALIITDWNRKVENGGGNRSTKGLIAVSFDQRNHGTRLVDPLANEAWRQGNPRHAQDMFSVFQGTARDVSLLIDYLPSFIFPRSERRVSEHLVLGVSLGGHAAWSCLLHEPRITAGVVIIGTPDYVNVMADRARLSKLPSWTSSNPPGSEFLGSESFPWSLLEAVRKYDPASLFLSHMKTGLEMSPLRNATLPRPTEEEKETLQPLLSRCLGGKRILNLSGGMDRLVPYYGGEAILKWLKEAISPGGWFSDSAVVLEDIIDETAAHEVTTKMINEAVRFVKETLVASSDRPQIGSKI